MGVDPKWGRFPICPEMSHFVLFSRICHRSGPQKGQTRTNGDKTGHFGANWETPPFRIQPHLALLKSLSSGFSHYFQGFSHDFRELSVIVSCDAAAIRIRIRIVRCQRPAKRQKHKYCETQAHFSTPTSPCWQ